MIENIFCAIVGETFSPKLFTEKTGLMLSSSQEFTANQAGGGNLCVPLQIDDKLSWLVLQVQTHFETILACGADAELLEISVLLQTNGLLNWTVSPENMAILGKLNIPICVTVYENIKKEETLLQSN